MASHERMLSHSSGILHLTTVLVAIFCSAYLEGGLLFEKSSPRTLEHFNYGSINSITYTYSAPSIWKIDLGCILKNAVGDKIQITETGRSSLDIKSMLSALMVYVTIDEINKDLLFLSISVEAEGETKNHFAGKISLTDHVYLLEVGKYTQSEIEKLVSININTLVTEYVAAHTGRLKESHFYVLS